jgi:hypothetical protein
MANVPKKLKRGKNIADILSVNENTTPDARMNALRRTMLVKNLCTSRCTTAEELQERFDLLFETCLANGFIPVVESLALCSRY